MTRMIPETIHSSVQSTAEKRIFEVIRDAPNTDKWVCFHSLGLAHHETKRRAEAACGSKQLRFVLVARPLG